MRNSMETLPINLNEGVIDFTWLGNSLLYNVNASIPSKDIYQAVCDEIGRFYQGKGFKYAPSGKRLEYQYLDFKIKIQFASSHYNSGGEWVLLEINTGIYPQRLQKQYKEAKEASLPIILTNVDLLDEVLPDKLKGTVIGVDLFGHEQEVVEEGRPYALRKHARSVNIYNISLNDFRKILTYLNKIIQYSFHLVLNESAMVNHINNAYERKFYFLKEKRFVDYLRLYHKEESRVYQAFLKKYKELEGIEFKDYA